MSLHMGDLIASSVGLTLLALTAAPAGAQAGCGGTWLVNPANGHEYRLTTGSYFGASDTSAPTKPDWWGAEAEAQACGGHLVTVNDAAENAWLVATFGGTTHMWIGFTDWGSEGTFYWISGEPVTFTSWDNGQPDNAHAGGEDTTHTNHWFGGNPGSWNDLGAYGNAPAHTSPYRGIIERVVLIPFCTAKSGLACGTPHLSATGTPQASATSGFFVFAGPARSCKSGILLYNTTSLAAGVPFHGGTLCVTPSQIRRGGPTNSGGTPGGASCDGEFTLDMNAFAASGWTVPDCAGQPSGIPANQPAAYLLVPGQDVYCQFWGRDSVATGSFLSAGISYTVQP